MLDTLRTTLHRAITTPTLDGFAPIRVPKGLARRLNVALGTPLCSTEELVRRRAARAKLAELRRSGRPTRIERQAAPVLVYFEKDRNVRELQRIEETLAARGIPLQKLDVTNDEATIAFVCRAAKVEKDQLPVVFVADEPIGCFTDLVRADASGDLARLVAPRGERN
jgi:glutaredoxin